MPDASPTTGPVTAMATFADPICCTTCVIIATYSVTRSLIETVRGDGEARGWVIPDTLSTSQAISIPVFLIGVTGLFLLRARRESGPVFARARAEAMERAARGSA